MLSCKNISKRYGSLEVLKGVDLRIEKGEVVSLVGSSGAGKSTLLHILGTLDEADGGYIELNGTKIEFAAKKQLQPVSWWKRLLNVLIDSALIGLLAYYCYGILLENFILLPKIIYWRLFSVFIIIGLTFYIGFEGITGRTPGKWITGSKIMTEHATRAGFVSVLIRSLSRYIPFEFFSFLSKTPTGQHDRISGTLVVDQKTPYLANKNDVKNISYFRSKHIGFVFQFHHLLPEFTALENVCIPGWLGGRNKKEVEQRAKELLKLLGLEARMENKPAALSGGEQQRVAVARALVNNPDIILADEPTGNLDSANAKELHQLFFDLRKQLNQTFLIVTHNEELAAQCDRTIHMKDGKIID
jgi:ABC-type lipoprotein export system ATPase subunit